MASSVENVLAGAKETLGKAKDFTKKVEGSKGSMFAPPAPAHEFTGAHYNMATTARRSPKPSFIQEAKKEGSDVAAGLKANEDQVKAVTQNQ
jgi:hypothetical protein